MLNSQPPQAQRKYWLWDLCFFVISNTNLSLHYRNPISPVVKPFWDKGWTKLLNAENFPTTKRAFLSPRAAKPAGSQHPWCRGSAGMWQPRWAWDFYVFFWFSAQVRTMVWCSPGNNPGASFPAAPRAPSPLLWQVWCFHPVQARLMGWSCRAGVIQQSRAGGACSWTPCQECGIRKVHKERERRVRRAPTT